MVKFTTGRKKGQIQKRDETQHSNGRNAKKWETEKQVSKKQKRE
jgi:hypothetical protein